MQIFATVINSIERISDRALLIINACLCLFVLIAHGGALLLMRSGMAPEMAQDISVAYFTVPIALLALSLAIAAIFRHALRSIALKAHAVVLLGLVAYMLYLVVDVIANGIPANTRFVWNPLLFAFIVSYPVFLLRRAFPGPAHTASFRYAPLWAVAVSVLVSIVVMWRVSQVAT